MKLRPIDIARKLNISTSTLRHYESWGMLPPVQRSASGYRIYTEEHAAYSSALGLWQMVLEFCLQERL